MASSFSIKVGADTTEFNKSLRAADGQIRTTTRLGDALTKTLEHKYDAKTAEQAQKQFQKALTDTQDKAESLRAQLKHMEEAGNIDSNQYRKLETDLAKATLEAAQLGKKLEDVDKMKFDSVTKNIEKVGSAIEGAGKKLAPFSAMAAGAIAGAAKLGKDAVAVGDDLMTLADKYEMSTTAIQRWQYVAMQSDVSAENLYKAAQKAQQAIGQQMIGKTNGATDALNRLGISFADFDSNEEAFEAIVKKMSAIENQSEQAAIAAEIFGAKQSTELIPLFKQSEDAIASYIAEFEQVGYLSEETVEQLADLDNVVNNVTAQFELAKTELGVAMIPVYMALIEILQDHVIPAVQTLAEWFDNLSPAGQNAVIGALAVIAIMAPLLIMIGKVATGISGLIKLLGAAKAASLATAAGFAALGGALMLGLDLIFNWKEMSTVEKILKSLAVAALVAAAAITVFQASWSLGIAVGAIAAGVVAGIAAIKAASDDIGVDAGIDDEASIMRSATGSADFDFDPGDYASKSEALKSQATDGNTYNAADYSKTDQSTNTYNIYVDSNEYVSADEIVEIVSKRIATISSARG